jgi:AbiV family abortive infection protein
MEECSKVDILGAATTSVLAGRSCNLKRLLAQLRRHEVKNRNNAYFSATTDEESAARERGDFARASEIFKNQQTEFHRKLNTAKERSV